MTMRMEKQGLSLSSEANGSHISKSKYHLQKEKRHKKTQDDSHEDPNDKDDDCCS